MTLHDRLTLFVRGTLGCQCPDDVFSEIVVRLVAADSPSPAKLAIEVGGRLLIHVVEGEEAVQDPSLIPKAVEEGLRARDARGFNRLRLVVAAGDTAAVSQVLQRRFAAVTPGDDRTHLHILPSSSIPW